MKSVLLVNPQMRETFYSTPCLGIAYLGASLRKAGHEVAVLDGGCSDAGPTSVLRRVAMVRPDYVGITAFSLQYPAARELFRAVKAADPSIVTVFGGQHVSALTEGVMAEVPEVDFAIRGEGELAFPALIDALASGGSCYKGVKGLAYRQNGKTVANPACPIKDVDDLEYPWQVVNPLDYANGLGHGFMVRRRPAAPVLSSRGCPYTCSFCAGPSVLGRKLRLRSPAAFVDEIEYLVSTFGVREVHIVDDNFTFRKEHAVAVCEDILRRRLDITWSLPNGVRADRVDYDLLKLMKAAGCYYLAFGIEFGSERMLRLTNKQLSIDKARDAVRQAESLGYITQGFFMMGHPQETREDVLETMRMTRELPLDRLSVSFTVPLPGSQLFQYYCQQDYLDAQAVDWESFAGPKFMPRTEFLSEAELTGFLRNTYLRFYTSPRRLIRHALKLRSRSQVAGVWPALRTLCGSMTSRWAYGRQG